MASKVSINFHAASRRQGPVGKPRRHALGKCPVTGLARYRDRHQARDGATALGRVAGAWTVSIYPCVSCNGWHAEKDAPREVIGRAELVAPAVAVMSVAGAGKRRYVLWDAENTTFGARATPVEVEDFWHRLATDTLKLGPRDHVVVGAARSVVRKYRSAVGGANVRWVTGADAPDGADRALLAAIDVRRVARRFDELVIVSGDGCFADLAAQAKGLGLTVHVVTAAHPQGRPMLSRRLAAVADTQTQVPVPGTTTASLPLPAAA